MRTSRRLRGFTLLEVMAAMGLLAIVFTVLMQVRMGATAKAATARSMSVAARLSNKLIHEIEAGLVQDLRDGSSGDFSEEGFGEFLWTIGIGDASNYTGGRDATDEELVWRNWRENQAQGEDSGGSTGGESLIKPEHTRVYVTVEFPSYRNPGEVESLTLETLIDTWAVEQDFILYRNLWPELQPAEIR